MEMDLLVKLIQAVSYLLMGIFHGLNCALALRRWHREKVNHE